MPAFRSAVRALFVLPFLVLGACGSDSPTAPTIEETTFASSLGIDLSTFTKTASGVYYRDVVQGTGPVLAFNQTVSVRYAGFFTNGQQFDPKGATDAPLSFLLGGGNIIQGWNAGLVGARVGSQRILIIPPSLGYGNQDYLGIPANSILVFKVTIVGVS